MVLVMVLALVAGTRAHAAEPTEEDLIKEGVELRKRNDDEGARAVFRRAYELAQSPRAAAQLALAEMALGRWADAEAHLDAALAASNDPWVAKNRATLHPTLVEIRAKLGSLEVVGGPAGAEIVVDGDVRGTLPLVRPVRVRIGEHRVELRAPGHASASVTVSVNAEHLTRERLVLLPNPITDARGNAGTVAKADRGNGDGPVRDEPGSRATRSWTTFTAYGLMAAGLVGVAGGGYLLLRDDGCGEPLPGFMCNKASGSKVPGWILVGTGAAIAVGGTILLYASRDAQVALIVGPGTLAFGGRW